MKNNIAIIYGGKGAEHEISLLSAEFVLLHIDREKFKPVPVLITKDGDWLITDKIRDDGVGTPCYPARLSGGSGLMTAAKLLPIFCALPILHGNYGEDGIVQGALECAGIRFAGCKTFSGALCADKAVTKTVAESLGIPTAQFVLGTKEPDEKYISNIKKRAELLFGYPMFIKPSGGGSSVGASRVICDSDFDLAYKSAAKYGERVIVEEAVDVNLELECAVFADKSQEIFTKIGSVSANGRFYDYDSKYKDNTARVSTSSYIDQDAQTAICEFSKSLVSALDIKQLSRIDFFLSKRGEIIFNEINTLPGLTEKSLYPRLMSECGISHEELITKLILGAC